MARPFNPVQRPALLLTWLQRRARASEAVFVLAATAVGALAGLLSVLQGALARTLQHFLFRLPPNEHLSSTATLGLLTLVALPLGGLTLSLFSWAVATRRRRLVDAVEANALHGGRMSLSDSLIVSGQTIISNGFGASVGLEAAYAQMGAVAGSVAGIRLRLRRGDLRNLVGAGTAGAIAAAFGAPLAGAFYAFEIVIGAYTPASIAPIAAAALSGAFIAQIMGARPYLINAVAGAPTETHHFLIYAVLGAICALLGIGLMRAVAMVEAQTKRRIKSEWLRPGIGGLLLVPIALLSPQALSAGHGALYLDLEAGLPLAFLGTILIAKAAGSVVSLGFGFRGGLFFASLFLGSLIGHLFASALSHIFGAPIIDPRNAALVGMAAFSVAVIGGPMTMAMLVLQATGDFTLTGAVIAASLVASTIVRELFGYSFSTWRLHLRGEAVKSARDVGWVKALTAGSMMRRETRATPASISVAEFKQRFPLGSTSRVVLIDEQERYVGIANPASAFAEGIAHDAAIGTLAIAREQVLTPNATIIDVMKTFDALGGDEMAVVDADGKVLGLLSESYVQRRYAEEMDKAQRELFGEL